MFYHRPKKIYERRVFQVGIVALLSIGMILANPQNVFRPIREGLWFIVSPLVYVTYSVGEGIGNMLSVFGSLGAIREENRELRKEVANAQTNVARYEDTLRENDALRAELELMPRDLYELESALVIGYDPNGVGGWVIINKGSADGISGGMPVIVHDGIVVGIIEESFAHVSRVRLITHSETTINAHTTKSHSKGIVRGRYGVGVVFTKVLQTDIIEPGDLLVTSEIGETFPPGLFVGTVEEVSESDGGIFREATISTPTDLFHLTVVSIILRKQSKQFIQPQSGSEVESKENFKEDIDGTSN